MELVAVLVRRAITIALTLAIYFIMDRSRNAEVELIAMRLSLVAVVVSRASARLFSYCCPRDAELELIAMLSRRAAAVWVAVDIIGALTFGDA